MFKQFNEIAAHSQNLYAQTAQYGMRTLNFWSECRMTLLKITTK